VQPGEHHYGGEQECREYHEVLVETKIGKGNEGKVGGPLGAGPLLYAFPAVVTLCPS
jgi:hypothetical protein